MTQPVALSTGWGSEEDVAAVDRPIGLRDVGVGVKTVASAASAEKGMAEGVNDAAFPAALAGPEGRYI
jgi:hypothetical protein